MEEEIQFIIDETRESMDKSIHHLEKELQKIRAGKASPVMLDGIQVEYYGAMSPLNNVATVSAPEPRMLTISPFEKKLIPVIEKAIREANLGYNPQNDGIIIRVPIPIMSEERRRALVKQAKEVCEESKIALRSLRRDANDSLKKLKNDGAPEDAVKTAEAEVQKITEAFSEKVEAVLKKKEAEIMAI